MAASSTRRDAGQRRAPADDPLALKGVLPHTLQQNRTALREEERAMLEALINTFAQLEDPRCDWRVEHKLLDILVIAVCAVIGEAESFEDIALYGRCKRDWLQRFLELRGGIPSHDTFRRVLMLIDPERFERCFLDWVRSVFRPDAGAPRQIAIDGKTVRGSFDRKHGRSPLHPWSALTPPSTGSSWRSGRPRRRRAS